MATDSLDTLSRRWNARGRVLAEEIQERLGRFHRGEVDDPQLPDDLRGEAEGAAVLAAVRALNEAGDWQQARRLFDPAHTPLIQHMGGDGLCFVVALGPDEALFRRGSSYMAGHLWHVRGGELTPLPEYIAAAASPDHRLLALADAQGLRVLRGWQGKELGRIAWPTPEQMVPAWVPQASRPLYDADPPAKQLEALRLSDDGRRVAIACAGGVLVGELASGRWSRVLPHDEEPDDYVLEELGNGETASFHGDMVHVALSADGRFVACGAQDTDHRLYQIDSDLCPKLWARLNPVSEYPHDTCFSGDAAQVSFNACHFYNGATLAASVAEIEGRTGEDEYEQQVINGYLRVYASTWLPAGTLPGGKAVFALAGSGVLTMVTPQGEVQGELLFGSSAGGIDYCPITKTLVLGSYSGFLHFLDPAQVDPQAMGWRPPLETKRWCFLKDQPPLQW